MTEPVFRGMVEYKINERNELIPVSEKSEGWDQLGQRVRSLDQRDVLDAYVRNVKKRLEGIEQKSLHVPVDTDFLLEYISTILDLERERITLDLKASYVFGCGAWSLMEALK